MEHSQTDLTNSKTQNQTHLNYINQNVNPNFNPIPSKLSIGERIQLIKSIGEEIIGSDQMIQQKLLSKQFPRAYDGFQPSGRIHIAQGLLRAINVNKMVDAGCIFVFWVADYFAMLNQKFDGDLNKIRIVGKYFIEVWKAAGMKLHNVEFLWASEEINKRSNEYWMSVMKIACQNTVSRVQKCATIMGKKQSDKLKVSQLFYPCMQCADISFLDVDFCQLGVDQRKVNMLALENCKDEKKKPVIVSHGMLLGLIEGQHKMSKSNPLSAIFMQDSVQEVKLKIKKAFCPQKVEEGNPILDYCKNIIFGLKSELFVCRSQDKGGNKLYISYNELASQYKSGLLHPSDLKPAVSKILNQLIDPIRQHFINDPQAKALLAQVQSFSKTSKETKKIGKHEQQKGDFKSQSKIE